MPPGLEAGASGRHSRRKRYGAQPTPDPLALLLLPAPLEEFELEEHARDLLRAPRVIALEPPRVSRTRLARLPEALALRTALRQAKRLKLPGQPRVVIVYDPLQTLLGLGLLARHPDAELWYVQSERAAAASAAAVAAGTGAAAGTEVATGTEAATETETKAEAEAKLQRRGAELDELARKRAAREISLDDLAPLPPRRTWFEANEPLWDRLEELEIAHFAG